MLLLFKGHYIDQILRRQKTATIRLWRSSRIQPGDPLSFNGRHRARVLDVRHTTVDQLTEQDAQRDGFTNLGELRAALREHYPASAADAACVVIAFELLAPE